MDFPPLVMLGLIVMAAIAAIGVGDVVAVLRARYMSQSHA